MGMVSLFGFSDTISTVKILNLLRYWDNRFYLQRNSKSTITSKNMPYSFVKIKFSLYLIKQYKIIGYTEIVILIIFLIFH